MYRTHPLPKEYQVLVPALQDATFLFHTFRDLVSLKAVRTSQGQQLKEDLQLFISAHLKGFAAEVRAIDARWMGDTFCALQWAAYFIAIDRYFEANDMYTRLKEMDMSDGVVPKSPDYPDSVLGGEIWHSDHRGER